MIMSLRSQRSGRVRVGRSGAGAAAGDVLSAAEASSGRGEAAVGTDMTSTLGRSRAGHLRLQGETSPGRTTPSQKEPTVRLLGSPPSVRGPADLGGWSP
ncbi:hypothetical protein CEQ11_000790 [Micrococcus sp. FDAARGOS_333]|nr:hypothetical protein CEQ11_000790 [Micrococcus sp. FDAARGOS_333]